MEALADHSTEEFSLLYSSDWKKYEKAKFTADDVMDAWESGYEKGLSEKDRLISEFFSKNLKKAQKESEKFARLISNKFGIHFITIHLRALSYTHFQSLIIIDSDSFLTDAMDDVYKKIDDYLEGINEENFNLDFSFMSDSDDINMDAIISDGYILRYDKERAPGTIKKCTTI